MTPGPGMQNSMADNARQEAKTQPRPEDLDTPGKRAEDVRRVNAERIAELRERNREQASERWPWSAAKYERVMKSRKR